MCAPAIYVWASRCGHASAVWPFISLLSLCIEFLNLQAVLKQFIDAHNAANTSKGVACSITETSFAILRELEKLASIGSYGRHPNHCKRDLVNLLKPHEFETTWQKLPLNSGPRLTAVDMVWQLFLLPHTLLLMLWNKFPAAFERLICPSVEHLSEFWASQSHHPGLAEHPMKHRRRWWQRCVPLSIHGDSVPITGIARVWSKSMLILSWCGLLGMGTTLQSQFLIYGVYSHLLNDTARSEMWRLICWSLQICWTGRWPQVDAFGNPYHPETLEGKRAGEKLFPVGEWFFVPWCCKGDLDYYAKDLY